MRKKRLHLLRILVSPSLESVALSKTEKFNLDFPYITLTMDSGVETRPDISVDVSVDSDGVLKSNYILQLYLSTGGVFFRVFLDSDTLGETHRYFEMSHFSQKHWAGVNS